MKFLPLNLATSTKWTALLVSAIAVANMKFVASIVVPEDAEALKNTNGSRALINPKDRENYADVRELARTIPCLVKFVQTYFNLQPYRIPILLPENASDTLEFAQLYLSALQRITSTYVFSGDLDPDADHLTTLNGIILVEDYEELISMETKVINLCGRDCKYLIVMTRTFPDEKSFLSECARMVPNLWAGRVANVVFLSAAGHTVLVARSLTFKPYTLCRLADPVLIAECDEDSNWSGSKWNAVSEMYLPIKMNKCLVIVAFFESSPYVTSEKVVSPSRNDDDNFDNATLTTTNSTSILKLGGMEGLIVNTLASNLNFVISAREIQWTNATSVAAEVEEALWGSDDVDMVLGGFTWAPEGETVYTLPYEMVQIIWLTPIRPNVSLQGLVAPLERHVWFAVIGLLVFASGMEFILTRNVSFLEILSLVIGVAWPRQPKILSFRIRFMSWVIFGYILTQFYLASLAGQLMASSGIQIETLEELADSSFKIGGPSFVAKLFEFQEVEDDPGDADENEISRAIRGKFTILDQKEYNQHLDDLMNEKNSHMVLAVRMNVSSMKPSFQGMHVHRMKEALASYPLSFAVWRGMPYLSVLDKKISSLIEGGIIRYWAQIISLKEGGYYDTDSHTDENNLNLQSLVPGFLLLIMGYGFAGIAFLMEIAVFRWQNRKGAKIKTVKSQTNKKMTKIKSVSGTKKDQRIERKLPDIIDTKAWIEFLNKQHQYRTPIRRQVEKKVHFPFEFVH